MNQSPVDLPPAGNVQPDARPAGVAVSLPRAFPYVTYSILVITVLVYIAQWVSVQLFGTYGHGLDLLEFYMARINQLIRQGQIWRLLSPVLLHANLTHILFNMYALYSLGSNLERHFGHGRFLILYLLAGFSGNVLSFVAMPDSSFSVGASTSIFGLIAAQGIFLFQNRKLLGQQARQALGNVLFLVVLNLLIGLSPGIDMYGHIGGLLGGVAFAWFAGPLWQVEGIYPTLQVVDRREARQIILGTGLVLLVFGLLAMWGMAGPGS